MKSALAGQGVIVTGGARGIGLGIAQRLAAEGCHVALWDLGFDRFDAAAAGTRPHRHPVMSPTTARSKRAFAATE
jgi:3-oxoacyl-[acyl-carrier protein] reductase